MDIKQEIFSLIFLLLSIFLSFVLVVNYQNAGELHYKLKAVSSYPIIGTYLPAIIFWLSTFFLCVLIVAWIVILFIPLNDKRIVFITSNGKLIISLKSIQNFVLYSLGQESQIIEPKVKIKMTRKKMKIYVDGYLADKENIVTHCDYYSTHIQQKVEQLIGEDKIKISVFIHLLDYEDKLKQMKNKQTKRVD